MTTQEPFVIRFGREVADARGRKKWGQEKLAVKSGVSRKRIGVIEALEAKRITSRVRTALADALGIPASF